MHPLNVTSRVSSLNVQVEADERKCQRVAAERLSQGVLRSSVRLNDWLAPAARGPRVQCAFPRLMTLLKALRSSSRRPPSFADLLFPFRIR